MDNSISSGCMSIIDICIPTYNRPYHIFECLQTIRKLANCQSFKILVCDNASNDPKYSSLSSFCKLYNYSYHRNYANFGANLNILISASQGYSPYVYIIGDDDKLSNGFTALPEMLNRYNPDYVVFADFVPSGSQPGLVNMLSFLRRNIRKPLHFNQFSHIALMAYKREHFSFSDGLSKVNSFYPHVWAWLSPFLSMPLEIQQERTVLVLTQSEFVIPSGISIDGTRAGIDPRDNVTPRQLEETFQQSLFEIWATTFSAIVDDTFDLEILKAKYCFSLAKEFPGSFDYLMDLISLP